MDSVGLASGMPLLPLSAERVNKHDRVSLVDVGADDSTRADPKSLQQESYLVHSTFSKENDAAAIKPWANIEAALPVFRLPSSPVNGTPESANGLDVQGIVARFNSLDIRDRSEERRQKDAAALQRAQMGREEAESDAKRLREENRQLRKEAQQLISQRGRLADRIEKSMEEVYELKQQLERAKSSHDKEVRKARKTEYKASSTLIKLQEELKSAKSRVVVLQLDLDLARLNVTKKDQDAFNAELELVDLKESRAIMQTRLKVVESERDALMTNIQEKGVSESAAQDLFALPVASVEDACPIALDDPTKRNESSLDCDLERLRASVEYERKSRQDAEDLVGFLKLECLFGCCRAHRYCDPRSEATLKSPKLTLAGRHETVLGQQEDIRKFMEPSGCIADAQHSGEQTLGSGLLENRIIASEEKSQERFHVTLTAKSASDNMDAVTEQSSSWRTNSLPVDIASASLAQPKGSSARQKECLEQQEADTTSHNSEEEQALQTPIPSPYRELITTTLVPLADAAATPDFRVMSISKEEAIEKLRARRGRARSIAGTPGKTGSAQTPRRDISAPGLIQMVTPRSTSSKRRPL